MGGVYDEFIHPKAKRTLRRLCLASTRLSRDIGLRLISPIRVFDTELSKFKIHIATNPSSEGRAYLATASPSISRESERGHDDDAYEIIPARGVASWQLVPDW